MRYGSHLHIGIKEYPVYKGMFFIKSINVWGKSNIMLLSRRLMKKIRKTLLRSARECKVEEAKVADRVL